MSNGSPAQLPSDAEVRNVIEQNGGNVGIVSFAPTLPPAFPTPRVGGRHANAGPPLRFQRIRNLLHNELPNVGYQPFAFSGRHRRRTLTLEADRQAISQREHGSEQD
jgi:hypothetical protein